MKFCDFEGPKGTKDWYGGETILRNKIRSTLMNIFERYGYDRLETPPIEKLDAISFKGGGEIQKEVFKLKDQKGRSLALRFDQTVPLARYISSNKSISFPFKRYVIGEVFRDGPTQPEQGRYRVFTQCDVDFLGVKSMAAEAELLALAKDAFIELDMGDIEVNINNRKLLEGILDYSGVPQISRLRTISVLDKFDKIGLEGVREELNNLRLFGSSHSLSNKTLTELFKGYDLEGVSILNKQKIQNTIFEEIGEEGFEEISSLFLREKDKYDLYRALANYDTSGRLLLDNSMVSKILSIVIPREDNSLTLKFLEDKITSDNGLEGLSEIKSLLRYSNSLDFDSVKFNPSLARGLDYYTGTTLEVFLKNREICPSAILAGGRFDNMIGDFRNGQDIPAVGFSFGLERLAMVKNKTTLIPLTSRELFLVPIGDTLDKCLNVAHNLRNQGINVDVKLEGSEKIGDIVSSVVKQGIPYIGFLGEDEIKNNTLSIKDLNSRKQINLPIENVGRFVKRRE